jgi:sulfotransferase family protein
VRSDIAKVAPHPAGAAVRASVARLEQGPRRKVQKGIWIASYPKSGNTWLRIFIHNLLRETRRRAEGREAGARIGPQDINKLNERTDWEIGAAHFDRVLGKPAAQASRAEIARARAAIHMRLAERRAGPFFIKTHNCVANVEGFPTVNMEMTLAAICIVRNPLDIAISYAHHCDLSIDRIIGHMADRSAVSLATETVVYEFMSSWSFHVASWMSVPDRPVLILRYEDLLRSPERHFSRAAAFLRIEPTPAQLRGAIANSSFQALAAQEARNGFVERPQKAEKFFRAGKSGQWREVLTRAQIASIIKSHAPMMQRFGYLPLDCGAPTQP